MSSTSTNWCNFSSTLTKHKSYTVYIIRTSGNTLYVGQTSDLVKRIKQHFDRSGKGAKYLRRFESGEVVYQEFFPTRSQAMIREAALKKLTHTQKLALITIP